VTVFALGCSATAVGPAPEKTARTSAALIQTDPTTPYTFPDGLIDNSKDPFTCEGKLTPLNNAFGAFLSNEPNPEGGTESYLALPTTTSIDKNGVVDSFKTAYTHSYNFNATLCRRGDLTCALESDFFSIPNAHGFKYNVAQILSVTCDLGGKICTVTTTAQNWYIEGVQRVDESWSMVPWTMQTCGGVPCPAPWTILDANSHPPYGVDAKSADWLDLWNVAYTYSKTGPNALFTSNIESTHHQCAQVLATDGMGGLFNVDFFVALEKHDPGGKNW
jgi:hypothetical protein